jgi:CBS domain-containing protein
MKEQLSAVLAVKGNTVHRLSATATVADAVDLMFERRIGSVVIMDGKTIAGIFTERDAMNRVLKSRLDSRRTPLREVMTRDVVFGSPSMTVEDALVLMAERRLRRLPVLHNGELVGLISIGDLARWVVRENENLTNYIYGKYPA